MQGNQEGLDRERFAHQRGKRQVKDIGFLSKVRFCAKVFVDGVPAGNHSSDNQYPHRQGNSKHDPKSEIGQTNER